MESEYFMDAILNKVEMKVVEEQKMINAEYKEIIQHQKDLLSEINEQRENIEGLKLIIANMISNGSETTENKEKTEDE